MALAETSHMSRVALVGERKQVTVLFAEISDALALIRDLDAEAAQQLLDPALHAMLEAVHRYEGTVTQVRGSGMMAVFGAPRTQEDHAARACFAALTLQAALRAYAEELRRTHGLVLQCHVGLHAGDVVIRPLPHSLPMQYAALGLTTDLAVCVAQGAPPDTILLTTATVDLVAGLVQVQAVGPLPIQALAASVEVCALLGTSGMRRRLQTARARGLTCFVGRQTELGILQEALAQAAVGHGQVVAVVGEAGVGKSRLVDECVAAAGPQGWMVLDSAAVSYGQATPYGPVIDLLQRYCAINDRDDPQTVRAKVTGQVLALHATLQDILPALLALLEALPDDSPFLRLEPPQRRQRTLEALKRVLLRASQVQPLILVFEDLHWLDAETQAVLTSLVESVPTARILVLVTYRPDYQHPWGSKTYYRQLRLDPLAPASATALLQALVGHDASVTPLLPVLIARTEGNPLFLEESVRTLVETQVLMGARGAYRLAQPLPHLPVPATVLAVLAARIDRLHPDEKQVLQAAAVLGTDVPVAVLQATVEIPWATVQRCLAHLQAAEFLYEMTSFPEVAYTFKHALTQEVAYHAILRERQQRLHARAAQAIEALAAERLPEHYQALAHHYCRSGNLPRAVDYLHRAGHQAVERSAYAEAVSALRTALDLLTTLPESRERHQQEISVQMTLGTALRPTNDDDGAEMERLYTRAHALCEQIGDPSQLFRVLWGLWGVYNRRGDYQTMQAMGEQLFGLAQRLHDPDLVLEAHHALWTSSFSRGELVAARAHQDQGRRLYDPQRHHIYAVLYSGHDPGVCCHYRAAPVLWLLGYPTQAVASSQAAVALAQQLAHPYSLTQALYWAAVLHHLRREAPLTQERAEAAMTLGTDQGFAGPSVAQARPLRGWALAACGHAQEGLSQLQQALGVSGGRGTIRDRAYHLSLLVEVLAQLGQTAMGREALTEALTTLPTTGACWWEAELHRLRGTLLLQRAVAQPEEAATCFQQALTVARRQQARSLELRAALSLSRLWQQQGKRTQAYALLAPLYGWFTEGFGTADLQDARVLLEELAR
jgi:class 3 adenylate cyclase/predicted ATPase